MLRRLVTIAALTLLTGSLVTTVPKQAEAAPRDMATARLHGLPPATAADPGGGATVEGQSAAGHDPHAADDHGSPAAARLSQPRRTPIVFSMVGFRLPPAAADPAATAAHVDFRVSTDGRTWSGWTHVDAHVDEGPDGASPGAAPGAAVEKGRPGVFSAPVWTGEQQWIQTRVTGASTEDVTVDLIDATGAERSLAQRTTDALRAAFSPAAAPAHAAPGRPSIVTRAQWGANEAWRDGSPRYASRVRFGVVHHTAGSNGYTRSQAPAVVRGIYKFHTWTRGWSDIGYQFLVDKFGTIYEGRHGGVTKAVIGAHAGGFNTGSFGVSLIGNYTSARPTSAQQAALAQLLAWKFELHHIDPLGTLSRTSGGSSRYRAGTVVKLHTLSGHRDVSSTTCPAGGYDLLRGLREEIARRSGPVIAAPAVSTWRVRADEGGDADPVSLSAVLRPAGPWAVTVRDSRGAVVHHDTGSGTRASSTWKPRGLAASGRYTWEITSDGRRTPRGSFDVLLDLVRRVGDGDTVPDMLNGIAAAAFPDDGSADHAVIARDDVFADALAGGPLAGTAGPMLFTPSDRLRADTRAELRRVLPPGRTVYVLGGDAAIDPAVEAALADTWDVVRLGGADRVETAVRVARVVRERHGGDRVMVARAGPDHLEPWADALAGGAWGARAGVPVLLTPTDRLHPSTRDAVEEWDITQTIVLGGTAAVSSAAAAPLPGVLRVAGPDRAGTSAAIARRLWGRTDAEAGATIALANGHRSDSWQPALAASPFAARTDSPLLLTRADRLSPNVASYLSALGYDSGNVGRAYAIGTPWRVSRAVEDAASRRLQ